MKPYSVLLLYPDYLAGNYGEDTYYYAHVEAPDVKSAQEAAQKEAATEEGWPDEDYVVSPADFGVLLVIEGHHNDLTDI